MSAAEAGALAAAVVAGLVVVVAVYRRPQRGLLILAALTPLNGVLAILPLPGIAAGWKEGLVLFTAGCAWLRRGSRPVAAGPPLLAPWWPAAVLFVVLGSTSALAVFGLVGVVAIKVTYFYLAVVVILWFAPFDAVDRDRLVWIMMVLGSVAAFVGIAQQVLGPGAMVQLGYEWGNQVRTTGGFFRTFSTFNQPFGFGLYVMVALLVAGAVALAEPQRRRNQVFLVLTPILALAMATAVVRAAILGLFLGVVWLVVIRFRAFLAPLIAVVLGIAACLPLLPPGASKVLFSSSSLAERSAGWTDIIDSILIHPVGEGLGVTGAAADRMATAADLGGVGPAVNYQPDNYYVKILLELGPVGLWVLLALLVTALVWTTRMARTLPGRDGALALGVSASIVATMAASLVATYFEIFPLDVYFWLLLGVIGCAAAQHGSSTGRLPCDRAAVASRPTSVSC
ncbi:hypothetical protein A5740_17300 [Mycobacterium sp. GA-1841]|uniref:O-antigen ligase family protein n=1 Tax=Mycobacterium sp. GA-1841 TaxID=1834154 RepID=UPI00096D605D|nr:O-antigen ligase family protein [Mycobacterium sp. GA-1841]OMC29669.1 hypothetical protein A5740_17300 [Mycobacterium sp. GA-1841]